MSRKSSKKQTKQFLGIILVIILVAISCLYKEEIRDFIKDKTISVSQGATYFDIDSIPEYTGEPYVTINNNKPYFDEKDYTKKAFEKYSKLDRLGRCGVAYANICKDIMPKKERESISDVYPTGWKQEKYNGKYLYNRCHLIGYQLAGENANKQNLITGTRYFNVEGMLPFENQVADYIEKNKTGHVLYRVTPVFKGNNLLASGVEIEAYSIEDNGKGICFNVYVYNVEPGVTIDYKTGESSKK